MARSMAQYLPWFVCFLALGCGADSVGYLVRSIRNPKAHPDAYPNAIARVKDDKRCDAAARELVKLLGDQDARVRMRAANALGLIDADTKLTQPALVEALKDSDLDVRYWASKALKRIQAQKEKQ